MTDEPKDGDEAQALSFDPKSWGTNFRPGAVPQPEQPQAGAAGGAPAPAQAQSQSQSQTQRQVTTPPSPLPTPYAEPAADAHEEPSLDIASWGRKTQFTPGDRSASPAASPATSPAAPAEKTVFMPGVVMPPPPPLPPAATAAPPAAGRGGRTMLLAGGAIAGVIALGVVAYVATRPRDGARPSAASYERAAAPSHVAAPTLTTSTERQVLTLDGGSGLAAALLTQGLPEAQAQGAAKAALGAFGPADGELRMEAVLQRTGGTRTLTNLNLQHSDGSGVVVTPDAKGGFKGEKLAADTKVELKIVRGQMDTDSFYSSAVAAGVNDALIPEFAQAFTFDFDFQREIHPGDVFEAAYEVSVNARGEPVGPKRLLYVSLTTPNKSRALYRFTPPGEKEPGWFDGAGRTTRRGLMRTPVQGARISSSFGWRVHPVLGFLKQHKGTDFAAPIGTPIYASGDGVVEWAAMKGPNGNLTILKHDNGWETYYLHQSKFDDGIAPGARVSQGQEIGLVGTTGRSTGPHLHYELHIDGQPVDAMAQPMDEGKRMEGATLKAFEAERDRIDRLRASGQV